MSLSMTKVVGALALLGATLLQETASQLTDCSPSSSAGFDYEVALETGVDIRWSVDTMAETISFEVFSAAVAWLSVGFSVDGMMTGSDAVIGLPDNSTVSEFDLSGKEVDSVIPYSDQEISAATVTQDATGTTITFTRPLTPATADKEVLSSTPGDETWLIYAYGSDNELAYHGPEDNRGNVLLDLFCGDTAVAAGTPAPSVMTTTSSASTTEESPAPSAAATSIMATLAPLAVGETATPTASPVDGGGGGGNGGMTGTSAPTFTHNASDAPTSGDDDEEDGSRQVDAAFRVGGGMWVAVATVSAAVLGAAMAV